MKRFESTKNYLKNNAADVAFVVVFLAFVAVFLGNFLLDTHLFAFKDWFIPRPTASYLSQSWDDEMMGHINIFRGVDLLPLTMLKFDFLIFQKAMFAAVFILPFIAFYFMSRKTLGLNPVSSFVGSAIFAFNPIVFDFFWGGNGAISGALIYAMLPVFFYLLVSFFRDGYNFAKIFLFAFMISIVAYNMWFLLVTAIPVIFLAAAFLFAERKHRLQAGRKHIALGLLAVAVLAVAFSLYNFSFNLSRTLSPDTSFFGDVRWSYQNANLPSMLQFESNKSNFFVYQSCYVLGQCNYGYFYMGAWLFVLAALLLVVSGKIKPEKHGAPHFLMPALLSALAFLAISLISNVSSSQALVNQLSLPFAIVRNHDKILIPVAFFLSTAVALSLNAIVPKISRKRQLFIGALFLLLLAASFSNTWDGYGGLTKYYYNDPGKNLNLLTITDEQKLPSIVQSLGAQDSRVLYLPYCSANIFGAGDQLKTSPYIYNVAGIRQGGTLDGYSSDMINSMKDFYTAISNNDQKTADSYMNLLGIDYVIINRNSQLNGQPGIALLGSDSVPYICGKPSDFIQFFSGMNYSQAYSDDDFVVFRRNAQPMPMLYGLSTGDYPVSFESLLGNAFQNNGAVQCNDCMVRLDTPQNVQAKGSFTLNSGNSFSVYFFSDWNNFIRLTFLPGGGIEEDKMKGSSLQVIGVRSSQPIQLGKPVGFSIFKFGPSIRIGENSQNFDYVDADLAGYNQVFFRFEGSVGSVKIDSLQSVQAVPVTYSRSSSVDYNVNANGANYIIMLQNYDSKWVALSQTETRSQSTVLGLNEFKVYGNDVQIKYSYQDVFVPFSILSVASIVAAYAAVTWMEFTAASGVKKKNSGD